MPEFYTLEEAARVLGMSPEEVKSKAQHREIHPFVDGATWRFRKGEIDEVARRRGMGSDPDLSLSDLDLTLPGEDSSIGDDFDLSEFQINVAPSDPKPKIKESKSEPPGPHDLLIDDRSVPGPITGSSSTIIGMKSTGKLPSDSDVRLVPDNTKTASDSDVRLAPRRHPSDSDVKLTGPQEGSSAEIRPISRASLEPTLPMDTGIADSSGDLPALPDVDSDFELTPSSVIDALEPESGSDFELTALDASSDEFDTTPLRSPSDSDVTGAGPAASGINLGRPSDSGINLQSMGNPFDFASADSIELAPIDTGDEEAPPAKAKPAPAASRTPPPVFGLEGDSKVDMSATSLPTKQDKDIFEDTDFEVDVVDSDESSDQDHTVQLEAASDFDVEEDVESASEVFALDEDDVDENAATAMARGGFDVDEEEDSFGETEAEDAASAWDIEEAPAPSSSQASRSIATPILGPSVAAAEWGSAWVAVLSVASVVILCMAFIGMDVIRNLYEFQGEGPLSGVAKKLASLFAS